MILEGMDFRLLDATLELDALAEHLGLIEKDMERQQRTERGKVETYLKSLGLTVDDPEWLDARQNCHERIQLLPRFYRGPFLVSVYGAYESTVLQIADHMRDKQSQKITIKDLRGDFLQRARKYYEHILRFDLCSENEVWERVRMLSDLRNAYAHGNGRMDMLNESLKRRIEHWMCQSSGISTYYDYIVCDACIVDEILRAVRGSLEDLIARYKDWDNQRT